MDPSKLTLKGARGARRERVRAGRGLQGAGFAGGPTEPVAEPKLIGAIAGIGAVRAGRRAPRAVPSGRTPPPRSTRRSDTAADKDNPGGGGRARGANVER